MRGVECDCPPSLCKAAPASAPVFLPKLRDFIALFAFATFMSLIAFASLWTENQRLMAQDQIDQEISWQR
jgi:hypothetical protein